MPVKKQLKPSSKKLSGSKKGWAVKRSSLFSKPITWLGVAAIAIVGGWYVLASHAASSMCQNIIVPAYFDPATNPATWTELTGSTGAKYVIVNPASGPGNSVDPTYVAAIKNLRADGITPLGYVDSGYTNVQLSTAEQNVTKWKSMYGISDIFIDEVGGTDANSTKELPYYTSLSQAIKAASPTPFLVLNPGTTVDQGYMSLADMVMIFENSEAVFKTNKLPSWTTDPSYTSKLAEIVYNVPAGDLSSVLSSTRSQNIGNVYVTDDTISSTSAQPYDTLPSYWSSEVTNIQQNCTSLPPPQNPTVTVSPPASNLTAPATFTVSATSNIAATITVSSSLSGSTPVTCTVTSSTTPCNYPASNYGAGSYTFTAKAVTTAGGSGSGSTTVTVLSPPPPIKNIPPTVSLTAGSSSYTAPASISLTALPKDSDGTVAQVKLLNSSGASLGILTAPPYTFNLTAYPAGVYTFTAVATDNGGATGTSSVVTVTVKAAPQQPPIAVGSINAAVSHNWWQGCDWSSNCSLTFSWTPVNAATSYEVRQGATVVATPTSSNFTVKPATSGFAYTYQIYAKNGGGYSTGKQVTKTVNCFAIWCAVN